MKRLAAKKLVASLSILAYLGMGSGLADQFVYCVGVDGHSAVERVHIAAACLAERQYTQQQASAEATASAACTDMPLLAPASNEQEKVSRSFTAPVLHLAYPLHLRPAPATCCDVAAGRESDDQDSPSRRTTVLRV